MRPAAATAPATPKPGTKPGRTAARPSRPAPTPTRTVYVTPRASQPPAQAPAPATSQPQLTNPEAVVLQYYQDVTDQNWSAAWSIGGDNIAAQNGQTYAEWVSGYTSPTASISVTADGTWSDGTVWTDLSATQLDGSVQTYSGTYTVSDGVITSASISTGS
jgi:hypothetical protein